ncbi:MAG TPA: tail fiber protein [Allosphingosinicella sp.]|nr:tail fiber protein [Allosphingosinicella sp.]
MADPFVAEIRMFGFNFAPTGWAQCNGQLLPISQNTALFSLLGTYYGGDGKSTFALPNLEESVAVHQGQGQGLSERFLGELGGSQNVTLLISEIPVHVHAPQVSLNDATVSSANGNVFGKSKWDDGQGQTGAVSTFSGQAADTMLQPLALQVVGSSLPHNNMMRYLTVNFCIAMQGVFPPRG